MIIIQIVLNYLKTNGLFFIDSNVVPKIVSPALAGEMGLPFTKRDVFIDNELEAGAIKRQLLKAKRIALSHGKVIVIGHDKKLTLRALKEMVPEFEKDGVKFVLVRDILK